MVRPNAFSALRWTLTGSIAQRAAGFVGLGIITRILAGTENGEAIFGAYQQLISLHMVVMVLLPLGFDQLLIREKTSPDQPRYLSALRVAVWILWGAVTLFTLAAHGLLADWLEMGDRAHLLWFFPLILALQTFRWGIKPLLVGELAFRRIASGEFLNTTIVMIGGAVLLYIWREAGALYVAFACGELLETIWLWRGRSIREMLRVADNWNNFKILVRKHRRFCAVMGVDQGLNTFSNNSPALLLGGLIGQGAVGLFGMANRLITVPVNLLIGAVGRISLPTLAGREESELQHRMLLTLRVSAAVIPPLLIWLVFFAPIVVSAVLGRQWADDAAPILQWLALNLLLQSLFSPISVIDIIRDRPEVTLGWNAANLTARALALTLAAESGVIGAIACYSSVSAVMWLIYGCLLAWLLSAGFGRFFGAWIRYIPLWLLLAGSYWLLIQAVDEQPLVAILISPFPAVVYFALAAVMDKEAARTLLKVAQVRNKGG